ncbi:MAG: hypothetical protein ACYC9X_10605 [Dehalococcoidia bacterium]
MLNKAFGAMGGLAGASFVGCLVGALSSGTSPLWIATGVSLAVALALGVGWYITHEDAPKKTQPVLMEEADHQSVVAGGDVKADRGSSIASHNTTIASFNTTFAQMVPQLAPPTVVVQVVGRCCWVTVTNNDVAEPFEVEVWGFIKDSTIKLRPRWEGGEESQTFRRGEQVSALIMCLEPDRPNIAPDAKYISIVASFRLNAWKARVEAGYRVVRFYGAQNEDVNVPENTGGAFMVSVLSDHHPKFVQQCSYAVTERCKLLMPFDKDAIARSIAEDDEVRDAVLKRLQAMADAANGDDDQPRGQELPCQVYNHLTAWLGDAG